jgi:hypothetical protein
LVAFELISAPGPVHTLNAGERARCMGVGNMQKKKTFSTMEIVLLCVLIGSLILSYLQSRREEE